MKYTRTFLTQYKEGIKGHKDMPTEIERVVESIRAFSKKGSPVFDCLIKDLPKLDAVANPEPWFSKNLNIRKFPKDWGISYSFSEDYKELKFIQTIWVPFKYESFKYFGQLSKVTEYWFGLEPLKIVKGKFGIYIRLSWED